MSEFQFSKRERLKSRKAISELFENGRLVYSYPVKMLYIRKTEQSGSEYPVKCGFTVSKKNFKRAVCRNMLKRRMREAYRINKKIIYNILEKRTEVINIFFIYISKEELSYSQIEKSVYSAIEQLCKEISNG